MVNSKYIEINGIQQFMYERIWDCSNPILLFLHGGPGSAFSSLGYLMSYLDKYFNVIHYDQRGSGKTLRKNPEKKATYHQLLEDLDVTIEYIKKEYNKEKVVLLGHSFGSGLGVSYLRIHPEKVQYYIGVGQVTNPLLDERVGYEKILEIVSKKGTKEELDALQKISDYPGTGMTLETYQQLYLVRGYQAKYGIASGTLDALRQASPIYAEEDQIDGARIEAANILVYDEFLKLNFMEGAHPYAVPFYQVLGERDYQVPWVQGAKLLENIQTVDKKLYLIRGAAHRPMLEQPEQFLQAVLDIRKRNMKGENE